MIQKECRLFITRKWLRRLAELDAEAGAQNMNREEFTKYILDSYEKSESCFD